MPRLIRVQPKSLMEVLGSGERCSPDPRRNTSKGFFEAGGSPQLRFSRLSWVACLIGCEGEIGGCLAGEHVRRLSGQL